jgi:cytochrome c553
MIYRLALLLLGLFGLALCAGAEEASSSAETFEFFERKIRPLLSQHCYSCHSSQAKTIHGGLRLDTAAAVNQGGDSGAVLVPGKPEESLLIKTVHYTDDIQMPPSGKLSDSEIARLSAWIKQGAPFPPSTDQVPRPSAAIDYAEGRKFWSFQPVIERPFPDVAQASWPRGRIDAFVLAAMEHHGLTPSPPADRATLIRRLYFDVIGLPPTPEQVRQFVNNDDPHAYEQLVDRLLESPQYGEKWSRWWLDMARYTDRTASWLYQTGQAHLYRDWVTKAFADDMPYDDFVRRQLATDLMPETGPEDLPALGFISLSPTYWKELKLPCEIINTIVADEWEERVDAVSRTFLGLTVACARCHDHKFDPISSEDYYALAGIFASCRQVERPLISADQYEPVRLAKQEIGKLEAEIAKLKKQKPPPAEKLAELAAEIEQIKTSTPFFDTPMANALSEESMFVVRAGKTAQDGTRLDYRPVPRDLPLFIRGNPNRPGPVVQRRFLAVLSEDPQPYQNGSGRLELAESIVSDAAPLAARVIVNRIWLAHFGQGIVATPSNFGRQGSPPTHPELLDDLATRFIANGWSIKRLHREILLSAAWQQSSASEDRRVQLDPDNRWLSRMNRRRLTLEEWRDAMLVASDGLDPAIGGPSLEIDAAENNRRTIYATVHRRDMSPTLMVHDFPDPTQHSPQRTATITALQGLYALNGPLVLRQAKALTDRLWQDVPDNELGRITRAYWLLFSRKPTANELDLGKSFLAHRAGQEHVARWQQYLHVLLASNEFIFVD